MRWMLLLALLMPVGVMVGCHSSQKSADESAYKQMTFSIDGMT